MILKSKVYCLPLVFYSVNFKSLENILFYVVCAFLTFPIYAAVVELADALDSKSSGLIIRIGSTPISGSYKEVDF